MREENTCTTVFALETMSTYVAKPVEREREREREREQIRGGHGSGGSGLDGFFYPTRLSRVCKAPTC